MTADGSPLHFNVFVYWFLRRLAQGDGAASEQAAAGGSQPPPGQLRPCYEEKWKWSPEQALPEGWMADLLRMTSLQISKDNYVVFGHPGA